jgi:hypothetical protein
MSKHYDKLLLLLAGLILVAALGFYFTRSATGVSVSSPLRQAMPVGEDYQFIEPFVSTASIILWEAPQPQDERGFELFDVFTPPKIWFNQNTRRFVFEPYVAPPEVVPFGVMLVDVDQTLYRLQVEGYLEGETRKPEDSTILVRDVNAQRSFRGRPGTRIEEGQFEIVSFRVIIDQLPDGSITRTPTVVIRDLKADQEVTLTTSRAYLPGSWVFTVAATDNPSQQWKLTRVGQTFDYRIPGQESASYTVVDLNFDNKTITLEKAAPYLEETEFQTLRKEALPERTTTQPTSPSASPSTLPAEIFQAFPNMGAQ